MKKRGWMIALVLACVFAVLAVVVFLSTPEQGSPAPLQEPGEPAPGGAAPDPSLPAAPGVEDADAGMPAPVQPPTADALRDDVARDPHSAPAALIEYAEKLAPKMEAAEASVDKAREFLAELRDCVMDQPQSGARPVQALCLANAAELAELHPELKGMYETISKNAPPAVVELLEAAESID